MTRLMQLTPKNIAATSVWMKYENWEEKWGIYSFYLHISRFLAWSRIALCLSTKRGSQSSQR